MMSSTRSQQTNGKSFKTKGKEGLTVKNIFLGKPKYITVLELRRPAQVTDKLCRDYIDFAEFDRKSMRGGIRNIH